MAQAIPGAELEVIPNGTHLAPLEHHREIAARISAFLLRNGVIPAPVASGSVAPPSGSIPPPSGSLPVSIGSVPASK
jgi:hypothetical protein